MKQTKNQSTYSCAGQKLTVKTEYISYQKLYLTFNSTKPSPVTVYLLQVKFESIIIIIISNAQDSVFYTDSWSQSALFLLLATKCPILLATKCPYFFYWPQNAPFLLLATKCPISFIGHKVACLLVTKWPVSFIGHKVANAFALLLPHSMFGHEVAHAFGVDIHEYIAI